MTANVQPGCCWHCGQHMGGSAHPIVLEIDGYIVARIILCAECSILAKKMLLEAWQLAFKFTPQSVLSV